ncbi:unnamed protein product [Angiostrongylus costaricensis]|uniref:BTB domain-containing protein n=1 Tax=Angiostrongylus costaricensis TaxID=334426 RepID=A0A0R3PTG1_ANGCS|nr:unnamed protein product [Angiostrongylus costaricensis]
MGTETISLTVAFVRKSTASLAIMESPGSKRHIFLTRDFPNWVAEALPCPFVGRDDLPCSIVIRPSLGTFLQYKVGDDLHIGISGAHSMVHSYWLSGICSDNTTWDNSVIVCRFDMETHEFVSSISTCFYNDSEWNCFDFVMEFLRFINFRNYTKTDFVVEFMHNTLSTVVKYSRLDNVLRKMAEALEDISSADADRAIDRQNFNCSQALVLSSLKYLLMNIVNERKFRTVETTAGKRALVAVFHQAITKKNE